MSNLVWKFENATPVIRNGEQVKYNLSLSAGVLAKLFENGMIVYEGKIQRGTKVTSKGKEIDIFSLKEIKEIQAAMVAGGCYGGATITLNYPKESAIPLQYEDDERMLSGGSPLQILDGQHRIRACHRWLKEWEKDENLPNPFEFEYPVVVERLTEQHAMQVFAEYASKSLKISKTRSTYLDVNSLPNYIVREVMKDSELQDKVECTNNTIKGRNNNVVTFSTLSGSITNAFKPQTREQCKPIIKFLIKFYNALINMFPESMGDIDFNRRSEIRKVSMKIEALTFYGYAAIAAKLINDEDWEKKLRRLKEKIRIGEWEGTILDRDNPIWGNNIFRSGDKIINNTSTQSYMANVLSSFVESGEEFLENKESA